MDDKNKLDFHRVNTITVTVYRIVGFLYDNNVSNTIQNVLQYLFIF